MNDGAPAGTGLQAHLLPDDTGTQITVPISYEIIRLFSEGLYQSPHKAIEELVANSFDAGATNVFVLTPRPGEEDPEGQDSIVVIDNGIGMDASGFEVLWRVADSPKAPANAEAPRERRPIGQFGIGKLAAFVLGWRLTHVSKSSGVIRCTSMDFHRVTGHQWDPDAEPVTVTLHELTEEQARALLSEVEQRDPKAWSLLFGPKPSETWTVGAISDFKDLLGKLKPGTLGWVIRSGLPLHAQFSVSLNGQELVPSKAEATPLHELAVGSVADDEAQKLGLQTTKTGVVIPGIDGEIRGTARLFASPLTAGKSTQYGRSHGFFVRVRGRVINLEDELFGLDVLNHAAWARFVMDVEADGLRDHLLSSREGVRESAAVFVLRDYLHAKFNACRTRYEQVKKSELVGLDLDQLLDNAPTMLIADPILDAVRGELATSGQLYYIAAPQVAEEEAEEFLTGLKDSLDGQTFEELQFVSNGPFERLATYHASTRILEINQDHPYIAKVAANSKNRTPTALIGTSEILTDALLHNSGIDPRAAAEFFEQRDRVQRLLAGGEETDATEVLRRLEIAPTDETALERAIGQAFRVLGFQYEVRGGTQGGTDGVLRARLGMGTSGIANYSVVYDAKTTSLARVSADKVDLAALRQFMSDEGADFAFVAAKGFAAEDDPSGALNKRAASMAAEGQPVSLIRIDELKRIVELHYRYGVTLDRLRTLFESGVTVPETTAWVDSLEAELRDPEAQIPLRELLDGLEGAKQDLKSRPNVNAVRAQSTRLQQFEPPRLVQALRAIETLVGPRWLEVKPSSGDVVLHHNADQIADEVERCLREDLKLTGDEAT